MSGQRCWAFGTQGRCELEGGHEEPHEIVIRWGDDDTITFDGAPAVVMVPVGEQRLIDSAFETAPDPTMIPVKSERCFTCGCVALAHDEISESGDAMCRRHQCRSFVPDF